VTVIGLWLWLCFLVVGKSEQVRGTYEKFVEAEVQREKNAKEKRSVSQDDDDDVYDKFILAQDKKSEVIESLENLSKLVGVSYELIGATEDPNLRLDIGIEGDFVRTQRFLKLVESQPYKTKVDRLELDKAGVGNNSKTWRARITVSFLTEQI
jgi:hypothetical protein